MLIYYYCRKHGQVLNEVKIYPNCSCVRIEYSCLSRTDEVNSIFVAINNSFKTLIIIFLSIIIILSGMNDYKCGELTMATHQRQHGRHSYNYEDEFDWAYHTFGVSIRPRPSPKRLNFPTVYFANPD